MIKRLFICLSVYLILTCFITSCKKESPDEKVKKESIDIKKDSPNLKGDKVIRDDKALDSDSISIADNSEIDVLNDQEDFQENDAPDNIEEDTKIYDVAEKLPEFPGGLKALNLYIQNETSKLEDKPQGTSKRAMISFVVEKDGTLSCLAVAKSSGDRKLDEHAKTIVSDMPRWTPAVNDGVNVRMKYLVPVLFKPGY